MNNQNQIKALFAKLSKTEQVELLKELTSGSGTSVTIADFAVKHQKHYGINIEFTVKQTGLDHAPVVTAVVHTAFGNFKGTGSNQKIAKSSAVEAANAAWK